MRDRLPDSPDSQFRDTVSRPGALPDRALSRQLFREMVKLQIEDSPLRRSQQRELIRFARRMGIDTFEARLILRAVEYECGVVEPAARDPRRDTIDARLIASTDRSNAGEVDSMLGPLTVIAILLVTWLLTTRLWGG